MHKKLLVVPMALVVAVLGAGIGCDSSEPSSMAERVEAWRIKNADKAQDLVTSLEAAETVSTDVNLAVFRSLCEDALAKVDALEKADPYPANPALWGQALNHLQDGLNDCTRADQEGMLSNLILAKTDFDTLGAIMPTN